MLLEASHPLEGCLCLVDFSSINDCKCKNSVEVTIIKNEVTPAEVVTEKFSVDFCPVNVRLLCLTVHSPDGSSTPGHLCKVKTFPRREQRGQSRLKLRPRMALDTWVARMYSTLLGPNYCIQCFKHVKFIETCTVHNFISVPFSMGDKFVIVKFHSKCQQSHLSKLAGPPFTGSTWIKIIKLKVRL